MDRVEEALPLIIASAGCAAIAVGLHVSANPVAIGRMSIWGLFAALAIIAGLGAAVSVLVDESDDPIESPMALLDTPDRVAVAAVRPPPRQVRAGNVAAPPTAPADGPRPSRTAAPIWLEADTDAGQTHSMNRTEMTVRPSPGPRPFHPGDTSPAEAIAEIDGLWSELQRMRRAARQGSPL